MSSDRRYCEDFNRKHGNENKQAWLISLTGADPRDHERVLHEGDNRARDQLE